MVPYLGDFKEDQAVYILFNTFTSNDPSASSTITNLADTDIHIHKDGAVAQHSAAAAADVSINFDGITGNHLCKINTDSHAFFAIGSDYMVRMEGTTVDGATINAWIGSFSIENRHNEVDVVKWLGQACHAVSENGVPKVDLDQIGGVVQSLTDFKDFVDAGYDPTNNVITGVADGALTAAKFGADCITNAKIANDAIAVENIKDGAITAAKIANAAIDNATFAADVGSTAHGTNIIALAVRKILEELNLDHLLKVTTGVAADADLEAYCVAGTVMAHILSTGADVTTFKPSTDSLQANRDHIGDGTNLTEAGGTGNHLTAINLPNQTMDITGNITGNLSGSVGSVTNDVGITQAGADKAWGTAARVLTAGTNLNDISAAEVNTQVADVIKTDTKGEPAQGAPGATLSLEDKIAFIYKFMRNKLVTSATLIEVYNDAGAVVDHKSTISDDGADFNRGEFVSGP